MDFLLLPGNRHDAIGVAPLIEDHEFDGLIADKALDANWRVEELNTRGAAICILQMPQRKKLLNIDKDIDKWRHLIENFFCSLKEFKRNCVVPSAVRACKTDTSFSAMIYLSSALINAR